MVDHWEYKGYEILFGDDHSLYIDGADLDGVRDELYGEIYTRDRVKDFIDEQLGDGQAISDWLEQYE